MTEKQWGGVRPGAGRPSSGFTERIFLDVTPLMKDVLDSEVTRVQRPRAEVLRCLLGKGLGVKKDMEWNSQTGQYEGVSVEGRKVIVDADEFAEAVQQAEKDKVNTEEVYSVSLWEELIGGNDNVRYDS